MKYLYERKTEVMYSKRSSEHCEIMYKKSEKLKFQ